MNCWECDQSTTLSLSGGIMDVNAGVLEHRVGLIVHRALAHKEGPWAESSPIGGESLTLNTTVGCHGSHKIHSPYTHFDAQTHFRRTTVSVEPPRFFFERVFTV